MSASKVHMGFTDRIRCSVTVQILRFRALLRQFSAWVLVLPVLAVVSTTGVFYDYLWPTGAPSSFLPFGAALAAASFVTASTCWVLRGDFFHRWLIYLTGCAWCRAIDLAGTEWGAAIAVTILIWYALVKFEEMRPYLQNRLLVSLLVGSLLCQCLPMVLTTDLAVWMVRAGIWPHRAMTALDLAGRTMLLISIVASEVMCRMGRISTARSLSGEPANVLAFLPLQTTAESAKLPLRKAA